MFDVLCVGLRLNMLENLPIIPSHSSQKFYRLFLFYSHIITYYSHFILFNLHRPIKSLYGCIHLRLFHSLARGHLHCILCEIVTFEFFIISDHRLPGVYKATTILDANESRSSSSLTVHHSS